MDIESTHYDLFEKLALLIEIKKFSEDLTSVHHHTVVFENLP